MKKMINGYVVDLTEDEIRVRQADDLAFLEQRENYLKKEKYKDDRKIEYPPIGDQLDAIWKQINQWRLSNEDMIQEVDDMMNKILAVKQKYPKPEEK